MRALFVLTPSESKRLIGKAVAALDDVKNAKQNGKMLISHGSTCIYVGQEILGKEKYDEIMKGMNYISGGILRGMACCTLATEKPPVLLLNKGELEPPAATMAEMLLQFDRTSLFIKGANAVDSQGNVAVFVGHPEGGTIGWALGTLLARGIKMIVPVGLEKLVSDATLGVKLCGQMKFDYSSGMRIALLPLPGAYVVTEIVALKILADVESFHVASGGYSGAEGAVVLVADGEKEAVEKAIALIESIKGEPPLPIRKGICETCAPKSPAGARDYTKLALPRRCMYEGLVEEDLPAHIQKR